MALGTGTVATAASQVNVGGRTIGGVAKGVAATDAVNVGQLNSAVGGLGADIATLFDLRSSDRRAHETRHCVGDGNRAGTDAIQTRRDRLRGQRRDFPRRYAGGVSLTYRLNTEAVVGVSVGASFAGHKNNGARVGVVGEF